MKKRRLLPNAPSEPVSACVLAVNLVFAQTAVARDSWFGIDQDQALLHVQLSSRVSYSALQAAHVKRRPALTGAIGVTAAFGVAREIHDKRTPGKWFSYQDLTWDALGIAAGAAVVTHTIK